MKVSFFLGHFFKVTGFLCAFCLIILCYSSFASSAERIQNKIALFSGLDKITGRITSFPIKVGETYQFGALQVTPKVCYTSPSDAPTQTDAFVQVKEVTLDKKIKQIFNGWMFTDSPGLNAVEHPIYDVWLVGCKEPS